MSDAISRDVHRSAARRLLVALSVAAATIWCAVTAAPAARADAARTISGYVSCANAEVTGIWVQSDAGSSGWAKWGHEYQWGGLFSASYEFTQELAGDYYLVVGCGQQFGGTGWATTVYSDTASGDRSAWACNDIPWWLRAGAEVTPVRALTLARQAARPNVADGRCVQV